MPTFPSSPRTDAAGGEATESRVDHALALLLADQPEAALQWAAAVVAREPEAPGALVVTSRLLEQLGRRRAAVEGLLRAVDRAVDAGDLPLAMAAIGDLRRMGVDVAGHVQRVAASFCQGSPRLQDDQAAAPPAIDDFQPLSPFLTGPALASRAARIVHEASAPDARDAPEARRVPPLPLFSALSAEALRDLLSAFETVTVAAGECVVREGEPGAAVYIVARGELEVSRRGAEGKPPIVLGRLGPGSFFGEMELLSDMPSPASLTAGRPSILLVARREAVQSVASQRPEVAAELGAHCRRGVVASFGRGSPLLADVPPPVRARLIERFEARLFRKGEKLVREGEEPQGVHLVVSGEVIVVAREAGESVLLATLTPGETVGEVELVLCRTAKADTIAAHPTTTLFLPRLEFFNLVREHPSLLPGMYMAAVRRHAEAKLALEAACMPVAEGEAVEALGVGAPREPVGGPEGDAAGEAAQPATTAAIGAASRIPGENAAAAELAARIERSTPAIGAAPVAPPVAPAVREGAMTPLTSVAPTAASVPPPAALRRRGAPAPWLAAAGVCTLAAAAMAVLAIAVREAPPVRSSAAGSPVPGAAEAATPASIAPPPTGAGSTLAAPAPTAPLAATTGGAVVHAQRRPPAPREATPKASALPARPTPSAATPLANPAPAAASSAPRSAPAPAASSSADFGGRN